MKIPDKSFWDERWENLQLGWDIGHISTPIKEYVDQLKDKNIKILIPGAGNAWEAEELWKMGFKQVYILDFSVEAVSAFQNRVPDFPKSQIIIDDFFQHKGAYDYIIEQHFFQV